MKIHDLFDMTLVNLFADAKVLRHLEYRTMALALCMTYLSS